MLAAFKLYFLPPAVFALVLILSGVALLRRSDWATLLFCVLAAFPQFWYPAQKFPGGTQLLTLLVGTSLLGCWLRSGSEPKGPGWQWLVWTTLAYTYVGMWLTSSEFNLPAPLSSANEDLSAWKNFAMMLVLYVVAFHSFRDEAGVRRLVLALVVILLLSCWREIASFVSGASFSYNKRANGAFWIVGLNANHFGAFIAELGALALAIGLLDTNRWRKRICLSAAVLSLYPLFYSYSRAAYIGLLIAVTILAILRYRKLLIVVAALLIGWQTILPDTVVERIQSTESEDGTLEESALGRLEMWELAKRVASDNPVFGVGYNGFYHASEGHRLRNAHNYFLQVLAEQGIVGLLLLLAILARAMYAGWQLSLRGQSDFQRSFGVGFLCLASVVVVVNLFGDRYSQLELGCYFWLLFGATQRCLQLPVNPQVSEPVAS